MSAAPLPFQRPQEYIACWPGDERVELKYDGLVVVVPAVDEVARIGQKGDPSPFRFQAARSVDGELLPGTVRLTAESGVNADGAKVEHFNPEDWLKGLYDVNEKLFARGLMVVMEPHEVPAALIAGRPLWIEKQLEAWEEEVSNERMRRKSFEERGDPVPPLSVPSARSLKKAVENLEKYRRVQLEDQISGDRLFEALGGTADTPEAVRKLEAPPPAAEAPETAAPEPTAPTSEKFEALARDLWAECKKAGVALKSAQKTGLLDSDPAVIKEVMDTLEEARAPKGEADG